MLTHWAVIFILLAFGKIGFIIGIRLKNVTIPHYGVQHGFVRLGCEFVLESDSLLVLKWYKDEQEFFRYTPSTPSQQQQILTFPSQGVFVDISQSGLNYMVLRNLTLNTTGLYKCEVSAEGSFRTLSGQGSLVVIAPPQSDPIISGIRPVVNIGDVLSGNCTLRRSKPAASLMFYINDEKLENLIEYAPYADPDGLESSFVGFNLLVEPRHFINGKLNIKCVGRIGNFYWVAAKNVSNANIIAQPSFTGAGQNRLSSSGGETSNSSHFSFSSIAYTSLIWYGCIIFGLLVLGILVTFCINYKQSKSKPSRRNSQDDVVGVSGLGVSHGPGVVGVGVSCGNGVPFGSDGLCVTDFKYRI